jgi:hypothetical protein
VAALSSDLVGPSPYSNKYSDKRIAVTCIATGRATIATMPDKCIDCVRFLVDLSNAAFLTLDDLTVNRINTS